MQRHPVSRSMGWVGLIVGSLLILASCGDDSGSVPFSPTVDDPDSGLIDTPPDPGDVVDSVDPPTEADRSADLVGSWEIVNYTLSDGGGLTNMIGEVTPSIDFMADGTLAFQTGCNGGSATWETSGAYYVPSSGLDDTPEGQSIQIRDISKEEVACDGFLGEQDADLAGNLEAAERFRLNDDGGMSLHAEFVLILAEPS